MADPENKGFTVVDRRSADRDANQDEGPKASQPAAKSTPAGSEPGEPPIDFATFVMSLASSVLIHLGELAVPGEPEPEPNLAIARQTIDLLGMLAVKTRGNLSDDESKLLEHLLYDLRLKFVEARRRG